MTTRTASAPTADQAWIDRALHGAPVWSIGQIDKLTERALNKLVKAGRLVRCRGHFCGLHPTKTIWCRPDQTFSLHEGVTLVAGTLSYGEAR